MGCRATTDPDARVMKMPDGGYRPAINVQLAGDTATQFITGFGVTNEGSDQNQLSPMLEQIHENTGKYPNDALVDGGFTNKKEIENCTDKGVTIYGPVSKPKDETRDPHQPLAGDSSAVADWRKRMGTDEAKEIYKERASTLRLSSVHRSGMYQCDCPQPRLTPVYCTRFEEGENGFAVVRSRA